MNNKLKATSWAHFEHKADIGIRGWAPTLAQAFEQAALAMTAVICELSTIESKQSETIRCEAADIEFLFLDWINELIYVMAVKRLLFARFQVTITDGVLTATAFGEPVDRHKHRPAVEIKGATLTELSVHRSTNGNWVAQCVVDV